MTYISINNPVDMMNISRMCRSAKGMDLIGRLWRKQMITTSMANKIISIMK